MPNRNTRLFDKLLESIGVDTRQQQLEVVEALQLFSLVDDLRETHPPASSGYAYAHLVANAGVAQFSAIELTPRMAPGGGGGMWVRKLFGASGTTNFTLRLGFLDTPGTFTVNDAWAGFNFLLQPPDGADLPLAVRATLADLIQGGNPNVPNLFLDGASAGFVTQVGRNNASPSGGAFVVSGSEIGPFFVPPNCTLGLYAISANAALSVRFELAFPPEYYFS